VLTGHAIRGYGNVCDNVIIGNTENNVLYGYVGNDTLYGEDGSDTINCNIGTDIMYGGTGDDTYYVDNAGDAVFERAYEGNDTVFSSATYGLSDHVENLTLTGNDAISGTGNAFDNLIIGNRSNNYLCGGNGDDILKGGFGADTMYGGEGNDIYYVDDAGDVVREYAGANVDLVYSEITYILPDCVENLIFNGTDAITGTGNALDNRITGNVGKDGGLGTDTLSGGAGSDTYQFTAGNGSDTIDDAGSAGDMDTIQLSRSVPRDTIAFFQDRSDLHIAYGDTDYITVINQDIEGIEKIQTGGWYLTDSDINILIQQITAYATDHGLALTSAHEVRNNVELMNIIANSWRQ